MVDAHAPCFAGLTTDQAGRIAEAMQGLPDDVRQFVRVRAPPPRAGTRDYHVARHRCIGGCSLP
jgi:hypothetical protein